MKTNTTLLNSKVKINRYSLLVFALAFGVVGYFIWHSFAAETSINDTAPSGNVITTISESFGGYSSSVQIGTDGLPVIAMGDGGTLDFAHCLEVSCATYQFRQIDSNEVGIQGDYVYMAIGKDGLPIISYDDLKDHDLKILHCGTIDCVNSSNTITRIPTGDDDGETSKTVIGTDGLPIVIFNDNTTSDPAVLHCGNVACTSGNTITVVHTPDVDGQDYTTIGIGGDGLPILGYPDTTTGHIGVTKCNTLDCTSYGSSFDIATAVGVYPSMFIGSDGLPVMSYTSTAAGFSDDLGIIHCGNLACSSGNTVTALSTPDNDGQFARLIIQNDGLPLIAYHDATNTNIYTVKCSNVACSSGNKTTRLIDSHHVGNTLSLKNGKDGLPIIAYSDATPVPFKLAVLHCGTVDCSDSGSGGIPPVAGDINGDGHVNITDLSYLLSHWNTSDATADFNHDGSVGIFDLSILLSHYGS